MIAIALRQRPGARKTSVQVPRLDINFDLLLTLIYYSMTSPFLFYISLYMNLCGCVWLFMDIVSCLSKTLLYCIPLQINTLGHSRCQPVILISFIHYEG